MSNKLEKDLYTDLFDENFLHNEDINYSKFVIAKKVHIDEVFIGHHKGKKAIDLFTKVKTLKTYQNSQKNVNIFVEQFMIDLKLGKFDGKKLNDVIKNLKRHKDDGKEENISLSECIYIWDRVKSSKTKLFHHEHTFPSWDQNLINELSDSDKEICFDISRNQSSSLFTREDYIGELKKKIPNIKKFNYDSYIAQIVNYLM